DLNTAMGAATLVSNTTGTDNTGIGLNALFSNVGGSFNTALGRAAMGGNIGGDNNTAVGWFAGSALTTGSNNIDIGNVGVAAESNTTRVGTQGMQTATFIGGISGAAVMGSAVHVNADGQLGTAPSSQRFKEAIKPMDKESEAILALKPVSF